MLKQLETTLIFLIIVLSDIQNISQAQDRTETTSFEFGQTIER